MSDDLYADAARYDRIFPGGGASVDFYRAEAARSGGRVLEIGSGTGQKLVPIAADGHACVGLELSPQMLAGARRRAAERDVEVEWVQGDMRSFDLGRQFDLVVVAANSLLHLHDPRDIVDCFGAVRRHLAPGGRLVLDVFNPSVGVLAAADGVRRRRDDLSFTDPGRGTVHVDVAQSYDAATQVTRGTWWFSTAAEPDHAVVPLQIRSIFPQELVALLALGGMRLGDRRGGWSGEPFTSDAPVQVCTCEPDDGG